MLPTAPNLPDGHAIACNAAKAARLGYWLATDRDGCEYVVNARATLTTIAQRDCWGKERTWARVDGSKAWGETTPAAVADTFDDALPERHKQGAPWKLPDGSEPDRDGKRGKVLQGMRNWCQRLLGVGTVRALQFGERLVWIHGAPGCGKTQALSWMLRDLASHGRDVHVLNMPDLILRLRGTYAQRNDPTARQLVDAEVERAVSCGVLGLDDLGAESAGEDTRSILYRILDRRLNNDLPTIATSNLAPAQMTAWDERLRSRASGFRLVELPGRDFRAQQSSLAV